MHVISYRGETCFSDLRIIPFQSENLRTPMKSQQERSFGVHITSQAVILTPSRINPRILGARWLIQMPLGDTGQVNPNSSSANSKLLFFCFPRLRALPNQRFNNN